jgi:hypothetical protein
VGGTRIFVIIVGFVVLLASGLLAGAEQAKEAAEREQDSAPDRGSSQTQDKPGFFG